MSDLSDTQREIAAACDAIKELLLRKNAAYGDSVMNPIRIFSRVSAREAICVRIDDKLSRLARGHALADESFAETASDLIGYLILDRIAEAREKTQLAREASFDIAAAAPMPMQTLAELFPEPDHEHPLLDGFELPPALLPKRYSTRALFFALSALRQGHEPLLCIQDQIASRSTPVSCIVGPCRTTPRAAIHFSTEENDSAVYVTCCREHAHAQIARDAVDAWRADLLVDPLPITEWIPILPDDEA